MDNVKRIPLVNRGKIDFREFPESDKIIEIINKAVMDVIETVPNYSLFDIELFIHEQVSCAILSERFNIQ